MVNLFGHNEDLTSMLECTFFSQLGSYGEVTPKSAHLLPKTNHVVSHFNEDLRQDVGSLNISFTSFDLSV